MLKILITGGAGFIGSSLAKRLLDSGDQVTILDNLLPQIHGSFEKSEVGVFESIRDRVKFIKGSVTSQPDVREAIADNEVVLHLAAETGTGQSMYEIERYTHINVTGTAILLDYLVNNKNNVKKVIVASSRAVYGEGKYKSNELGIVYPGTRRKEDMINGDFEVKHKGCFSPLQLLPTDEESKIHPTSVYGITKLNQEQLITTVCKAVNIPHVVLRLQNVYGPGQSLHNPYTGLLSIFSSQIKKGNSLNVFEDGKESRDFVYIDDVIDALNLCIHSEKANNEIFNVGSGVSTNINTVVKLLMICYKKEIPVTISGDFRIGDIRHNYADLSKIKSLLGFTPKVSFEDGVHKFTEWVNASTPHSDDYENSILQMQKTGLLISKKLTNNAKTV